MEPTSVINTTFHENDSLDSILKILQYYVFQNPERIPFSNAFIIAFRYLMNIDTLLMPELNTIKLQDKAINESVDSLKMNIFRLQLKIIVKRKHIIQQECPDNPNIKRLIEIFNRKIEALINVVDAQNDMEGDPNDPLSNAYMEIKDDSNITNQIYKQSELVRTAKNNMNDLNLTKTYYENVHKGTTAKCNMLHELYKLDTALRTNWTEKGPQYHTSIQRIKDYKQDMIQCQMELKTLEETMKLHDQTLNRFKVDTYDTTVALLEQLVKKSKEHLETTTTLLDKEFQSEKNRGSQLNQLLKPDSVLAEYKIIFSKINQTGGHLPDDTICLDELNQKYTIILQKLKQHLDDMIRIISNIESKKLLMLFIDAPGSTVNENSYKYQLEIADYRSMNTALERVLGGITHFLQDWHVHPREIPPQIVLLITEYIKSLQRHYTESKEKHAQRIAISTDPARHTSTNKPFVYKHICQLDTNAIRLTHIASSIQTITHIRSQKQQNVNSISTQLKDIYMKAMQIQVLKIDVNLFIEAINKYHSTYIIEMKELIELNNQLISLHHDQTIVSEDMNLLKQLIEKEQKLAHHINPPGATTGASFGETANIHTVYYLYQKVYLLYYRPEMIQSYVLLLHALKGSPDRSLVIRFIPLHYERVDSSIVRIIKDIYDMTIDTNVVITYNKTIRLTSEQPSLIVQNISLHLPDDQEISNTIDVHVHVGMCLLTVLKSYLHRPETINNDFVTFSQQWLTEKQSMFDSIDLKDVSVLFDRFVRSENTDCRFVLYEHCETPSRDPMYRFAVHDSGYHPMYKNLQIDYYNTCLPIGYVNASHTYKREDAVQQLNDSYHTICEHYMLEHKFSRIYFHNSNLLHNDIYFDLCIVSPLVSPSVDINVRLKFYTICTKKNHDNRSKGTYISNDIVTGLIDKVKKETDCIGTEIKNYHETEVLQTTNGVDAFVVSFVWKKNNTRSKLFVINIPTEHINETETYEPIHEEVSSTDLFISAKKHSYMYYQGVQSLIDPCWSTSALVQFDVPKDHRVTDSFGTFCDLTIQKYAHEHVWVVLDTTDTSTEDTFSCPFPYIDTTFLEVLNDFKIIRKTQNVNDNREIDLCNKRIQFFTQTCYDQVISKLNRLLEESGESGCTSDLTALRDSSMDLFPDRIDEFLVKLNTQNKKSSLGKLFQMLGYNRSIVNFNSNVSHPLSTRFSHHLISTLKNFFDSK